MRNIRFENVTKAYNGDVILDNLNLTIPSGQFFALLGPSGSGKTTLLRLIGGFERVSSGKIFLGDRDITDTPVNKRSVNTVFQNYALFPHLNVFHNVAYSLNLKNLPKDVVEEKVIRVLKAVRLENHIYKDISQLSGGQQQRVALARAIVNEPDVLLLDEPLAALDVKLREAVLLELIELHDKLKTTFVYVTHDQLEALTVADKMAIMNYRGEIEQIGTPKQIYEFPISSFVAKFVGTTNILKGTLCFKPPKSLEKSQQEIIKNGPEKEDLVHKRNAYIDLPNLGCFEVYLPYKKEWMNENKHVVMSIRPEKIYITKKPIEGFSNMLEGIVDQIVYHGRSTQYNVKLKDQSILQVFDQNDEHFPQEIIDYDNHVYLYWQKENVVLLER